MIIMIIISITIFNFVFACYRVTASPALKNRSKPLTPALSKAVSSAHWCDLPQLCGWQHLKVNTRPFLTVPNAPTITGTVITKNIVYCTYRRTQLYFT